MSACLRVCLRVCVSICLCLTVSCRSLSVSLSCVCVCHTHHPACLIAHRPRIDRKSIAQIKDVCRASPLFCLGILRQDGLPRILTDTLTLRQRAGRKRPLFALARGLIANSVSKTAPHTMRRESSSSLLTRLLQLATVDAFVQSGRRDMHSSSNGSSVSSVCQVR